jgi:carbamate kinase
MDVGTGAWREYSAEMSRDRGCIVVALGGNAISREDEEGNVPQQFQHTRETAVHLVDLIVQGYRLIVTHGNGPQVGNVLRRVELAAHELYTLPLDICGAHTQGGMGYMIAQCISNELKRRHDAGSLPPETPRFATALVTSVEVDPADPEFAHPTKPVGRFYDRTRAEQLQTRHGWRMVEQGPRGYRRVVPSPRPQAIVEIELIARLAADGEVLVAAGGGGIPVVREADGQHVGVEAVIDKDRTSALLAVGVDAAALVIATNVDGVALDYGQPTQRVLAHLSASEARRYLEAGQFPAGSMGPKIESAIEFLLRARRRDAYVLICDLQKISTALAGGGGTRIVAG